MERDSVGYVGLGHRLPQTNVQPGNKSGIDYCSGQMKFSHVCLIAWLCSEHFANREMRHCLGWQKPAFVLATSTVVVYHCCYEFLSSCCMCCRYCQRNSYEDHCHHRRCHLPLLPTRKQLRCRYSAKHLCCPRGLGFRVSGLGFRV